VKDNTKLQQKQKNVNINCRTDLEGQNRWLMIVLFVDEKKNQ
jgi:hypothetical protein